MFVEHVVHIQVVLLSFFFSSLFSLHQERSHKIDNIIRLIRMSTVEEEEQVCVCFFVCLFRFACCGRDVIFFEEAQMFHFPSIEKMNDVIAHFSSSIFKVYLKLA